MIQVMGMREKLLKSMRKKTLAWTSIIRYFVAENGFALYCQLQDSEWVTCDRFPEFETGEEHFWRREGWTWTLSRRMD